MKRLTILHDNVTKKPNLIFYSMEDIMREAERALVRACIEQDKDMPFEEIMERTNLSQDKVRRYIEDVMAESGNWNKFFAVSEDVENIVSPWELSIDDELLDQYKKEINDKTDKIKPLLIMKMYTELESDKRIAQNKLNSLKHSPHQGSRWLELKMKARNDQIKLLGLDAAEKLDVSIGLSRSKEERDSIFKAAQARNLLPAGSI